MPKLNTYVVVHMVHGRQVHAVVATTSYKKLAELLGLSLYYVKTYGSITGNAKVIETASEKPDTIFVYGLNTVCEDMYLLSDVKDTKHIVFDKVTR